MERSEKHSLGSIFNAHTRPLHIEDKLANAICRLNHCSFSPRQPTGNDDIRVFGHRRIGPEDLLRSFDPADAPRAPYP